MTQIHDAQQLRAAWSVVEAINHDPRNPYTHRAIHIQARPDETVLTAVGPHAAATATVPTLWPSVNTWRTVIVDTNKRASQLVGYAARIRTRNQPANEILIDATKPAEDSFPGMEPPWSVQFGFEGEQVTAKGCDEAEHFGHVLNEIDGWTPGPFPVTGMSGGPAVWKQLQAITAAVGSDVEPLVVRLGSGEWARFSTGDVQLEPGEIDERTRVAGLVRVAVPEPA